MFWFIIGIVLVSCGMYVLKTTDDFDEWADLKIISGISGAFVGILVLLFSSINVICAQFEYRNFKIKYDEIANMVSKVNKDNSNVLLGIVYGINIELEQKKLSNRRLPLFNDWFVDDRFENLKKIELPEHLIIKNSVTNN